MSINNKKLPSVKKSTQIMKPVYGYWKALLMSFYSKNLYIDVFNHWKGFGIIYLLFVIALASIPLSIRMIYNIQQLFQSQISLPIQSLPLIYVQNGEIQFDEPMPFFIKNKAGEIIDIIDTTGKINKLDSHYPKTTILITKNKIYFRASTPLFFFQDQFTHDDQDIYVQSIKKSANEVFNGQAWVDSVKTIKLVIQISIYPLLMMFIYGIYLVFLAALAFLGQLFSQSIFEFKMTFKQAVRLFFVSSTPQLILFFILFASNFIFPGVGIVYLVLLALYFNFAVLCIKHDQKKISRR